MFNNQITRSNVNRLVPREVSLELIDSMQSEGSAIMRVSRRLRNMTTNESELPVLGSLSQAYFVEGDNGLIPTSGISWKGVTVYARKLGVIVPIPRDVLEDTSDELDFWGNVQGDAVRAMGLAVDNAVALGTDKPSDWPDAIVVGAAAAGNTVALGTGTDVADDIFAENGMFALVEEDGFAVTGSIADLSFKAKLRGLRASDGQFIFKRNPQDETQYTLDGETIYFPMNGYTASSYPMITGDWRQLVYSVREDIRASISDQATLTDASGNVVFNLFQQEMVALKLTMRLGFALPNPVNAVNSNDSTRYPFSVLTSS